MGGSAYLRMCEDLFRKDKMRVIGCKDFYSLLMGGMYSPVPKGKGITMDYAQGRVLISTRIAADIIGPRFVQIRNSCEHITL